MQVAERQLDEGEVAAPGEARDAQEGDGARLGGDDREQQPPPGDVPVADHVVGGALLRRGRSTGRRRRRRRGRRRGRRSRGARWPSGGLLSATSSGSARPAAAELSRPILRLRDCWARASSCGGTSARVLRSSFSSSNRSSWQLAGQEAACRFAELRRHVAVGDLVSPSRGSCRPSSWPSFPPYLMQTARTCLKSVWPREHLLDAVLQQRRHARRACACLRSSSTGVRFWIRRLTSSVADEQLVDAHAALVARCRCTSGSPSGR